MTYTLPTVHRAGFAVELVQRCSDCGEVLINRRGEVTVRSVSAVCRVGRCEDCPGEVDAGRCGCDCHVFTADDAPGGMAAAIFWTEGALVLKDAHHTELASAAEAQAFRCTKKEAWT